MKLYGYLSFFVALLWFEAANCQCFGQESLTFSRWSGVSPSGATPVFVYSASGDEASLTGACLARCRELSDCAAVAVAYGRGNCQGLAEAKETQLEVDSDVSYFQKTCLELPPDCKDRWWSVEITPGYQLHTEGANLKVVLNSTVQECYAAVLSSTEAPQLYRSAQWVAQEDSYDPELIRTSDKAAGTCLLNVEDKFTEPESYRVASYHGFYLENQCRYDYSKKIDRCSYEEYFNQTLKHVELTITNYTKDECRTSCETEDRFVCRGFTWSSPQGRKTEAPSGRGLCDLHSEDLVSTGSWLLRRSSQAVYYRRVICLNITVECSSSELTVIYRPRGAFRGRVYVPGRGEQCGARAEGGRVRLTLPVRGDCDVNYAHAITYGASGMVNRTMAYVMVMIQNNPIIQTAGDRWVRVGCSLDKDQRTTKVDAAIAVRDTGKPSSLHDAPPTSPAAASAVFNSLDPGTLSMYVVRADSVSSPSVALGEPLELRIDTTKEAEIEAYHLVASSRLGDSSVLLLDSRGCPTGQVDFPAFARSRLGGTQRLSARFKAFRFPSSHVVRFAVMVRTCDTKCHQTPCMSQIASRAARGTNDSSEWTEDSMPAAVREESPWARGGSTGGVVAQGGVTNCGGSDGKFPLELEMMVGSGDVLSADTLVHADHQANQAEQPVTTAGSGDNAVVCVHELVVVALALSWLLVQLLLLLACCFMLKRYRNLAELSMQKDYHSFDNVGFDTGSTHRRVHWPDQTIDILHAN